MIARVARLAATVGTGVPADCAAQNDVTPVQAAAFRREGIPAVAADGRLSDPAGARLPFEVPDGAHRAGVAVLRMSTGAGAALPPADGLLLQ
jgi:hypothetical protein